MDRSEELGKEIGGEAVLGATGGDGEPPRIERSFGRRSRSEQEWLLDNSWCSSCGMYDLGMSDPREYSQEGRVFIEGKCRICRSSITSEIVDQRTADD